MSDGRIHERPPQEHGNWEAPPENVENTKGNANIKVGKSKPHHVEGQKNDTIEKSDKSEKGSQTEHLRGLERRASGAGYATLSQNELDALQTGDPIIYGHKGATRTGPPAGPGGTGNPFFNPNPMVMFFTCFFKVMQTLKWLELVATKLCVNQMKITKEAGKSQAEATLEAGKAAFKAEMGQAITSFMQAGVSFGTLAMAGFARVKAGAAFDKQKGLKEATAKSAGDELTKAKDLNKGQMKMLDHSIKGKTNFLNEKRVKAGQAEISENPEGPAPTRPDATRASPAHAPGATELRRNSTAPKATEDPLEAERDAHGITKEQTRAQTKYEGYKKEAKDLNKSDSEAEKFADQKMERSIQKDKAKLDQFKKEEMSLEKKAGKADNKLQHYQKSEMKHIGELMQQDPDYVLYQAGAQAVNQGLMGLGQFFKARGDLEKAYWDSQATIFGMSMQIDMKGLDVAMSTMQDSYQQCGEIAQTLTKMADQEASSMRWSA